MLKRLTFAALIAFMAPAFPLGATDDPETVVKNFYAAIKNNDFFGASGLIHTESLEKLRTEWNGRVLEHFDDPVVLGKLQSYTHGDPKNVVSDYTGRVVFERFMEYLFVSNSKIKSIMQRGDLNIVGSKTMAGTTIVQIEYVTEENSRTVTRKDSVRTRKDGLEWKLLLSRELDRALELMLHPPVS